MKNRCFTRLLTVAGPLLAVLALAVAAPPLPAHAQESAGQMLTENASAGRALVETEYAVTEFIPEAEGIAPGETFWLAMRQDVEDGWHVFWENPGDAGLPLELNWTLPEGFSAGAPIHPVPEYFSYGPLANFAHEGEPVFLIPVTAPETLPVGDAVSFGVKASWQVCEDICVPEDAEFSFTVPMLEAALDGSGAGRDALFAQARAALPQPFDGSSSIAMTEEGYRLTVESAHRLPQGFNSENAYFFPAVGGLIAPAEPQKVDYRDGVLTVDMAPGYLADYDGETVRGVLGFTDAYGARRGVALAASFSAAPAVAATAPGGAVFPASGGEAPLLLLFIFAFLGGVILNIMPCVFPIIFVKAAALMQTAGEDMGVVRRHGLLYTAGVLATFLLIGVVLLTLRAGGEQLGWGFHLQSPPVVALSAYVLFLVGLNLAGVFHAGESLSGAGGRLAAKGGGTGAFFTGFLAVVVAAPCLGPLLTAPMGAVMLQPPAIGLSILTAMALGLAAPYLALSFAPGLGKLLPKPGAWMNVMKQAMAFPVFAAAAYFLWVFAQQTGGSGLALALSGAIFLAFAAWLFELSKKSGGLRLAAVRAVAGLAALVALVPLTRLDPVGARVASDAGEMTHGAFAAEPFSAEMLAAYRAEGRPVFVDFTAAWCVTCQFNKATVFSSEALARDFEAAGVVFMVADWTLRDPRITEALEGFNASGVPLYAFYGENGADPKVLPLPLTQDSVRNALMGGEKRLVRN